jgi:hypothetical protein
MFVVQSMMNHLRYCISMVIRPVWNVVPYWSVASDSLFEHNCNLLLSPPFISKSLSLPLYYLPTKVKAVPLHAMKALWGEKLQILLILDLGTRRGWVVSVTSRPRFSPGERTPGTHCTGNLESPRAGLDTETGGKILSPLPGIEPRSPDLLACRHYTDWATLLTYLLTFMVL